MKEIVEALQESGRLYKKIEEVQPRQLGIRNRIRLFRATERDGSYAVLFVISQKSRLLMKDVTKLEEIYVLMTAYFDHNFRYRVLLADAPLCSKAERAFVQNGWELV